MRRCGSRPRVLPGGALYLLEGRERGGQRPSSDARVRRGLRVECDARELERRERRLLGQRDLVRQGLARAGSGTGMGGPIRFFFSPQQRPGQRHGRAAGRGVRLTGGSRRGQGEGLPHLRVHVVRRVAEEATGRVLVQVHCLVDDGDAIVDVAHLIAHRRLVRGEAPLVIHDKLVLVRT